MIEQGKKERKNFTVLLFITHTSSISQIIYVGHIYKHCAVQSAMKLHKESTVLNDRNY